MHKMNMGKISFLCCWVGGTSLSVYLSTYLYVSFRSLDFVYVLATAAIVALVQSIILYRKIDNALLYFIATVIGTNLCISISLFGSFALFVLFFFPPVIAIACCLGGLSLGLFQRFVFKTLRRSNLILIADVVAMTLALPHTILVLWTLNDTYSTASHTITWVSAITVSSVIASTIQGITISYLLGYGKRQ